MTIQQMEYIVAVDTYRHFVKAAESCGVSQSTLSMMIKKVEEELDTPIFDRDAHPIRPTVAGEKIIAQMKVVLFNTEQIKEMSASEKALSSGDVHLAMIPTVASDLVPQLFLEMQRDCPEIRLHAYEIQTCDILEKLKKAEIDIAIMATPLNFSGTYEIPLYYEKLVAYVSPSDPLYASQTITSGDIPCKRMWTLKSGNCMRDQIFRMCKESSTYTARYEAGNIDTLVRIVDANGGFTIIPELHLNYLSETQKQNVRDLVDPEVVREISLVIRTDFVRERILNEVASAIKKVIPERMIDSSLKKFSIRL